jgi:plasmid stabilization system protein ParE
MDETTLSFHPSAESEVLGSFLWYTKRAPDAADAFQDEIEQSGRLILRNPSAWPPYLHGTQKYVLKHFPFTIVFRATKNQIEIIAVAHHRRRPGYWAERLNQ